MFRLIIFLCFSHFSVSETIQGRILLDGDEHKRVPLPMDCYLLVQLQDSSLADAPATILKQIELSHLVAFPIPYQIEIPTDISPALSYSLVARITKNDALLYINDQHIAVNIQADNSINMDIPVRDVNHEVDQQKLKDEAELLSWPEMLGHDGGYAVEYIKEKSGLSDVFTVPEGSPVTKDYRTDRVRVFVGENGNVTGVPYNG